MYLTCIDEDELFDPLIPLFNKVNSVNYINCGDIYCQFRKYGL